MRISHKPADTVTNKLTTRRCLRISERNVLPRSCADVPIPRRHRGLWIRGHGEEPLHGKMKKIS